MTIPLTFDELDKAEQEAAHIIEKQKVTDAKRLIQYPIRVRKVKRLRRQISGLNRCIRDLNDFNGQLFRDLQVVDRIANWKISTIVTVGIVCFGAGWLLG